LNSIGVFGLLVTLRVDHITFAAGVVIFTVAWPSHSTSTFFAGACACAAGSMQAARHNAILENSFIGISFGLITARRDGSRESQQYATVAGAHPRSRTTSGFHFDAGLRQAQ
jgi:hypothetical protein